MTKSFIALVAAVGVAFAATSVVADDSVDWTPFPPKDDGKRNLTRFKPRVCDSDRTWAKCAFKGGEYSMQDLGTKANRPAWKPTPAQDWRSKAFRADGE